ncbi:hypothetical protein KM043_006886 [Ampulex compressa]|nr:hypothetical protein KM043_006886 [Ampulex compressa]
MLTALVRPKKRREKLPVKTPVIKTVESVDKNLPLGDQNACSNKECLTNEKLSIMTDSEPEVDHEIICLRKEKRRSDEESGSARSSRANSTDSYVIVASEEIPVFPAVSHWESVQYDDITNSLRTNSRSQKYCSPKCSSVWYLKIRREILKALRNKVYPHNMTG